MCLLVVQAVGLRELERKSGLMATACSGYQTFTFSTSNNMRTRDVAKTFFLQLLIMENVVYIKKHITCTPSLSKLPRHVQ